MSTSHRHSLYCWLALLLLGGLECGVSFLHFRPSFRPLLMVPALCMVAMVAVVFMRVRHGVAIVRAFALAGLVWLTIMLGLGSMDPLTRAVYVIQGTDLPR